MKKIFNILLALSLLFLTSTSTLAEAWEYKDLPDEEEAFRYVDYMRREGIFSNTPYVRPDSLPNKVDLITWIVKLHDPDFKPGEITVNLPFLDTYNDHYYSPYLQEALNRGYVLARGDYFRPYSKVSVGDVAQILFTSHGLPVPMVYGGTISFADLKNHRQQGAIMKAYESKILPKTFPQSETFFGVYNKLTKAEVAEIFYKFNKAQEAQSNPPAASSGTNDPYLQDFNRMWQAVDEQFYPLNGEYPDKSLLLEGAADGLFDVLGNPYSKYYNINEAGALSSSLTGDVVGVGMHIGEKRFDSNFNPLDEAAPEGRTFPVVVSPIKDSPAEAAGLQPGDIIIKVDGKSTEDQPLETVASWIRGTRGTDVALTLLRDKKELSFTITRVVVKLPNVDYETRGDVMWVQLHQFSLDTGKKLGEAIQAMQSDLSVKGMVLDLRNNPGGLLTTAIVVTQYFVEPGAEVVTIKGKDFDQVYSNKMSTSDPLLLNDFPVVVLVNKGSASASEIVAGTLQDYGRKVIGDQTFGKGSVQSVNDLQFGAFKINVAGWFTASGRSIEEQGVMPDVVVSNAEEVEKGSAQDVQLNRAIEEVRKLF